MQCTSETQQEAKKHKPAEEPVLAEPELRTAAPDASADESPAVPSPDATAAPTGEQGIEGSENPEIPSPAHPDDPDVEITWIEFVEPGRPTVLAKCSAKEELLEHRRASWTSLIMLI